MNLIFQDGSEVNINVLSPLNSTLRTKGKPINVLLNKFDIQTLLSIQNERKVLEELIGEMKS